MLDLLPGKKSGLAVTGGTKNKAVFSRHNQQNCLLPDLQQQPAAPKPEFGVAGATAKPQTGGEGPKKNPRET